MDTNAESIAVVIPALNEAKHIGGLLEDLWRLGIEEIAVADGGSTDDTVAIVASFPNIKLVRSRRGRGPQINAAVRATSAPIILVLHADTRLPHNAPALIRRTLTTDTAGGCFRLAFDQPAPLLRLYAWFSRFETSVTTFGDQAFFMRRTTFEAIGGAPDWPFLEDVALRDRIRACGRFVKRPESVVTSARRFMRRGPLLCQLRNVAVIAGFRCGVPVGTLATFYDVSQTG